MENLINVIRIELRINDESKLNEYITKNEIEHIEKALKNEFPFIWYSNRENKFYSNLE